jgi:peptidyl-prolyl cis-trans isomerase SurA
MHMKSVEKQMPVTLIISRVLGCLVIVSALLAPVFAGASSAAMLLDRIVAVVNKEVITWSELYKMMEFESSDHIKALNEEDRLKVFRENESVFLEKLIDMRLQMQEARASGVDVPPEDVAEAIDNIKKKYSLTDGALEESLKSEGITFEEYKKKLAEQMLISQYVNRQIRSKIIVSDQDVKTYMDAHKEKFASGEAFRMRVILLRRPEEDPGGKLTENKASLIMERLGRGEDFSDLAEEYSADASGKAGGDVGFIPESQLAKEFSEVLSSMKTGDYSEPFWTDKGIYIIKLDDKISEKNSNEIRETIKKQLIEERFAEKYKVWIKGLRENARIEIRL